MNDEDLRDLFAGLAMVGLIIRNGYEFGESQQCDAYEIADRLVKAKYAEDEPEEVGIAAVVKRTRKKNVKDT